MINITEVTLEKYKIGHTPSDGEIIWSKAIRTSDVVKKMPAINRLSEYIINKDSNKHEYYPADYVQLIRIRKDAAFNDQGEIIFKKSFTGNIDFHKKAVQRLARYLSKVDNEYDYYGKVPLLEKGENCYCISTRNTKLLDDKDKERIIAMSIRGQKAAITKNINKAKKIKEKYMLTLIPDGYKTDKRYISLVANLWKQKRRLHIKKQKRIEDIESFSGGLNGYYSIGDIIRKDRK